MKNTNGILLRRSLWLSLALSAPAWAQNADTENAAKGVGPALEAAEISIDKQNSEITAAGNVVLENGGARLVTELLRLNRDAGQAEVPGPLTLTEADGSKIEADAGQIDERLDRGTLTGLRLSPAVGGRFAADRADKNGADLRLDSAVFTACPACEKDKTADPLWQIRAARIDYDRAGQNVVHRHARLEVYGWPVFYLPVMAHAGPEVERRSGFLAPALVSSGDFGTGLETPYFFDLASNYDLTLTPRFSEKQDPFLTADWRHLTRAGRYEATFYGHSPKDNLLIDADKDLRGGVIGSGDFNLAGWQLKLGVEHAGDDAFFRSYRINAAARMHNRAVLSRNFENQSLMLEAHHFRNTVSAETADTVDEVLPRLHHNIYFADAPLGSRLNIATTIAQENRSLGIDVGRFSSRLNWSWRQIGAGGFVWSLNNRLALDAFDLQPEDETAQKAEVDAAEEALAANATAFGVAYPLRRESAFDTQTLTPRLQLVLATDNEDYDSVPHISLGTADLTAAQLFRPAAPKDETSRVNVGLDHGLVLGPKLETRFFIGQSYNLSDRDNFTEASGYGARRSALLADWGLTAGPLSLSQNARFNKTGTALLRSESSAKLTFARLSLSAAHSFYEAGQQSGQGVLEEGTGQLDWTVSQHWSLTASTRENLETKKPVRSDAVLSYEDDCTVLALSVARDYSRISASNIEPETSLNFTFTLKTIGG